MRGGAHGTPALPPAPQDRTRKLQRRFPTPQVLARKALDSSTLQAGGLIIVGCVIAAPYLSFNGGLDEVELATSAFQFTVEAAREAGAALPLAALASVFCDRQSLSGVEPFAVSTAAGSAACPSAAAGRASLVTVQAGGGAALQFNVFGQQRAEALAAIYLDLFAIAAVVVLSVTLSEAVGRQVVRPLDTVWAMLTVKSQEAYSALRHLGAFAGPEDDLTDSTERMVHQLSRMALCFKGLAAESEGYLLEQYLGPDDAVDAATRQWLLGQAGHELHGKEASSGGLNFVQAGGVRSGSSHVGLVTAIRSTSNTMAGLPSSAGRPAQRSSDGLLSAPLPAGGGGSVNLRESGAAVPRIASREMAAHSGLGLLLGRGGLDRDDARQGHSLDEGAGPPGASPGGERFHGHARGDLGGSISQLLHLRSRPPSQRGHSGDLAQSAMAASRELLESGSGSDRASGLMVGKGVGAAARPSGGKPRGSAGSLEGQSDHPDPRSGLQLDAEPPWAGPCRGRDLNVRCAPPTARPELRRTALFHPSPRQPDPSPHASRDARRTASAGPRALGRRPVRTLADRALQIRLCHF